MTRLFFSTLATLMALAASTLGISWLANAATPESGRMLRATLSGSVEVPGPGDADATGTFTGRVNPGRAQLCYNLKVANLARPTMAHIHEGATGVSGPPVVSLRIGTTGFGKGCSKIDKTLAQKLVRDPENYYVNVHNEQYPSGGARGQLGK